MLTDGGGADHFAIGRKDGRDFGDGEAVPGRELFEQGGVAGTVVTEVEPGADADMPAEGDLLNEVFCSRGGEGIVEVNEDEYMISLAVAGFGLENLSVTKNKNFLIIEGKNTIKEEETLEPNYLHRGISSRDFRFERQLADHVEIENAHLELGILNVHLKREIPEEQKPKSIAITYTS